MKKDIIKFTSESVSEGHPDKVADQISDAIVDAYLLGDPDSRVACEVLVTTDKVVVAGEIYSTCLIDVDYVVRETIKRIGYVHKGEGFDYYTCKIDNLLHNQNPQFVSNVYNNNGVDLPSGDQGIMFGYAVNESVDYIPLTLEISHLIMKKIAEVRKKGEIMKYLRPDGKSQVTIDYDSEWNPLSIDTIVVSTQYQNPNEYFKSIGLPTINDEDGSHTFLNLIIKQDIEKYIIQDFVRSDLPEKYRHLLDSYELKVNPFNRFEIGGPDGDTGLTGRKIVVDTYGGRAPIGGGALSGKCPTKIDRFASYITRYLAKNLVAAGVSDEVTIQISYIIGHKHPVSIHVNTHGRSLIKFSDFVIANFIKDNFDLTPHGIITLLDLKQPIYEKTAAYGHFGRNITVNSVCKASCNKRCVQCFPWERLDSVDKFKKLL